MALESRLLISMFFVPLACSSTSANLGPAGNDGGAEPADRIGATPDGAGDDGETVTSEGGASGEDAEASVVLPGILAATPPMGWNSWNRFQGNMTDALIRQIADAMVSSGMAAVGYQYVIIDDGAWPSSRDSNGIIVSDPARFPDMKGLSDYVHGKGLKFGIYSDRGRITCSGRPGSYGYEAIDARTYADWGVDYVKYDNCNPAVLPDTNAAMQMDYTTMSNALKATGRPMVFSISGWWFYPWEPQVSNLWRTTTDIQDNWASITALLDRNGGDSSRYGSCTTCPLASGGLCVTCTPAVPEAAYAPPGIASATGPGHWNDPDMLEVGNGGMTDVEDRSHFSLWSIMAAPLIAGNDLRTMTAAALETLTNAEVIAVDQDPLGIQGVPLSESTTLEVWSKRLAGAQSYAIALLNRTETPADITVAFSTLGITSGTAAVRDLWAHQDLGTTAMQYTAPAVPAHGVAMLKVVGQ